MHTPGPWTHDPEVTDPDTLNTAPEVSATLPNGDTRYICRMFGTDPQVIEESQANARLIAQAPNLLDLLTESLMYVEECEEYHKESCRTLSKRIKAAIEAINPTK